jgi:hypothetical protein
MEAPPTSVNHSSVFVLVLSPFHFQPIFSHYSVIMKSSIISSIIGAALLAQQAIAHPGESHAEHVKDVQAREAYLSHINKRSLAHCAEKLKARGNDKAMHARRSAKVESLRKKRSISQGMFSFFIFIDNSSLQVYQTSHSSRLVTRLKFSQPPT